MTEDPQDPDVGEHDPLDALREIVVTHMRRQTRALTAIIVVLVLGGGAFTYLADTARTQQGALETQQQRVARITHENRQLLTATRQSTYVGCTLLANAITMSGVNRSQQSQGPARRGSGQMRGPRPHPRVTPQSRFNTLLVAEVIEHMAPAERRIALRLQHRIARSGGVTVPDCKDVVSHPERVHPIQIKP
jgi:hypothetical protein